MEQKFIYDLMLAYFVTDDELRPTMKKVHAKNGFLYAADGHVAIRIKQEKAGRQYSAVPGYPDAERLIQEAIDRKENKKAVIKTGELIRLLSLASWKRLLPTDGCEECDGSGTLECEHCGSEYECRKCNGTGRVSRPGEMVLLKNANRFIIRMGNITYMADSLYRVALTAQVSHVSDIRHLYANEIKASVFSFDGVDIIVMPYTADVADAEIILE